MRSRRTTHLLCLALLAVLATTGCPANPPPERPRPRRGEGLTGPRVRVGSVLRLARAGVLELVQHGKVRGVAARVAKQYRSGGWQRAIDSQGNQFRVSPAGLLITDGEPHPGRQPASVANVAYYYTQAYSLMAARYRRQGMVMAAEVLDLPDADPSVKVAQRSLCALFAKIGIVGKFRTALYRNLVGVAHLVKGGAHLQNHVHGFAVVVPLSWQVLANSSPRMGKHATAMAFAFRAGKTKTRAKRSAANLLWVTRPVGAGTSLQTAARMRLSTTAGSSIRASRWKAPAGLGKVVAYEVSPVKYKGRRLHSLQLFFTRGGRLHQLNLLTSPKADQELFRNALGSVLRTFRLKSPTDRCATPK
jgi:hypothetical protein